MFSVDVKHAHTLSGDEYTLTSAGFMGGKHVLVAKSGPAWLQEKSFLGEDGLSRDASPITVIALQRRLTFWFIDRFIGKLEYLMVQDGFRTVSMIEGTADDIIEVLIIDRSGATA